jgi:diguanylate cyclase (GGDEF)-like protein
MPFELLLTGAMVLVTISAQGIATAAALRLMQKAGRFRLAWGAISLALVMMIGRRVSDGIALFHGHRLPPSGLLIALVVSVLLAGGMLGVRELFAELERSRAELYEEATRDELTHISNRRHVLLMARHEVQRARRSGRTLTFLLLDIDNFKKVNDTLGHERGDEVLRLVTDTCAAELRASDLFGRIGGDEFLIVLPEQEADAAHLVAERLRAAVEQRAATIAGLSQPLSISIGYTAVTPTGQTADELVTTALAKADDALYRAKQEGRNRVVRAAA